MVVRRRNPIMSKGHYMKKFTYIAEDPHYDLGELVILTDYSYWVSNLAELQKWCEEYDANLEGLTVSFKDHQSYVMFKLKWG
jgi:hypothetical protein